MARTLRRVGRQCRQALLVKPDESQRILVCCGCHMIAWYPADALDEVLEDLARWAVDPSARDHLPWPKFLGPWDWSASEHLAVWHAGRVLALVTKPPAGEPSVTRFDPSSVTR